MREYDTQTKVRNWRIVAGILVLLLVQAVLGRMDSEARLEEAERVAQLHVANSLTVRRLDEPQTLSDNAKPPAALQRQAAIGHACRGVL